MAKTCWKARPITKVGIPMAMVVDSVTSTSRNEYRETAATIPARRPRTTCTPMAARPSLTVLPSFSPRMSFTGRRKVNDSPMSPWASRPM